MGKMFTENGIEVTKRIQLGKTKFFEKREDAKKLTEMIGYYYPVFDATKNVIGYGVPK
jgi:hypothetical protein